MMPKGRGSGTIEQSCLLCRPWLAVEYELWCRLVTYFIIQTCMIMHIGRLNIEGTVTASAPFTGFQCDLD